ncbi:MAG: hypothetical protein Q8L92_11935 [Rubrivivax sp.]|nr:hypothetical protein [Rubrivivax sp.]
MLNYRPFVGKSAFWKSFVFLVLGVGLVFAQSDLDRMLTLAGQR